MSSPPVGEKNSTAGFVDVAPLTGEAAAAICRLASSLGLDSARIDLAGCSDKAGLLARTADALGFPAWFGHNWDALADCLTDLAWRPAPGYVLVFEHASELQESEPEVFDTVLALLSDVATAWQQRGGPFRIFVSARPAPDPAGSPD